MSLIFDNFFFIAFSDWLFPYSTAGTSSLLSRQENIFMDKKKKKAIFWKFNCHYTIFYSQCWVWQKYILHKTVEDTIATILLLRGRYCCCTLYKRLTRLSLITIWQYTILATWCEITVKKKTTFLFVQFFFFNFLAKLKSKI